MPRLTTAQAKPVEIFLPSLIFTLALLIRLPELDHFLTADEPLWIGRSYQFAAGLLFPDHHCPTVDYGRQFETTGWSCTFQIGYPGVTTTWLGGLGLVWHYWHFAPPNMDLRTFFDTLSLDPPTPAIIASMRLPAAVAVSLALSIFYLILARLLNRRVAFIAALLLALSPFHIALSRVLHHDALTAAFVSLSILAMIGYWLRGWSIGWLLLSAFFAGLGFLTKSVSWFTMPFAALVGLLALYYRRRRGEWRGWVEIGRVAAEGLLWFGAAWLSFAALFPAMWVIPGATLQGLISANFELGLEGHKNGHFFLGDITLDPGPLFYPVAWLLRASPLEVVGLLALPVAVWLILRPHWPASLRRQIDQKPVFVALALFVGFFLLFETISGKKMDRYFLPAFPIINIFVAAGLLWAVDRLARLSRHRSIKPDRLANPAGLKPWTLALLAAIILLVQGWLVITHRPHYFTYFNPLLGGATNAVKLMTVYGWGEGLSEAAEYLNQQPQAESLFVRSWYPRTLAPYFPGRISDFSIRAGKNMEADYLVYYTNQLQRNLQRNTEVWVYLSNHYQPVNRVTLQNLEYVTVFRNPIIHKVDYQTNSLPDLISIFGYNLAANGDLTLFWQNLGLSRDDSLWAGLAEAKGGEPAWVVCRPQPGFTGDLALNAIAESSCPLDQAALPTGLYDLRLKLDGGSTPTLLDFPAGRLAISIDSTGQFNKIDQATALNQLLEAERPAGANPLDIRYGELIRLTGYRLDPAGWSSGQAATLSLYWQPLQQPDLALAHAFELVLKLSNPASSTPISTTAVPFFPKTAADDALKQGQVIAIDYGLPPPSPLEAPEYVLDLCLTLAESNQPIPAQPAGTAHPVDCISLPVVVGTL